jgi:hypothetical protein
MKLKRLLGRLGLALAALLLLMTVYGYIATRDAPTETRELQITLDLVAPPTATGAFTLQAYQAWAGQGELRHALEFISKQSVVAGSNKLVIQYPENDGTGLVLYVWQDSDGDGVLCTPTTRNELAGLVEIADSSAAPVTTRVELTRACAGPEFFFPR